MKTLSVSLLLLATAAGLSSCCTFDKDYCEAGEQLDAVDQYRQKWGSMTISSVIPVVPTDQFGFDPGYKDADYLGNALKEVNVTAAQSLANTIITSLSARASLAQPINLSKAPTTTQPDLPTVPDANITATPLPLKDLGNTTIPMRLALLQAYNDKVFTKILDLTGHPPPAKGHKVLALICVVSCVPGTQTSTGYKGVLLGSVDYARHPEGDKIKWEYGMQDPNHYVPGILAVLPLSDSEFIRENNLNKDASTLALSLAALFEAQGISIGADAMFKASKELDTSRDSTVAEAATLAMPTARGFSLIFNPTFQAVADLAAKKSPANYKIQAQTFPVLILMDIDVKHAQQYNYLSVSAVPRWESLNGSQPSPSITSTLEIADKLDDAYSKVDTILKNPKTASIGQAVQGFTIKTSKVILRVRVPSAGTAVVPTPSARGSTAPATPAPATPAPATPAPATPAPATPAPATPAPATPAPATPAPATPAPATPAPATPAPATPAPATPAPATPAPATPAPATPVAISTNLVAANFTGGTNQTLTLSKKDSEAPTNVVSEPERNDFKNLVLKGSLDSLFDRAVGYQQIVDITDFLDYDKDQEQPTIKVFPDGASISNDPTKKFYLLASSPINLKTVVLYGPGGGNVTLDHKDVQGGLLFEITPKTDTVFTTGSAVLSLDCGKTAPLFIPVTVTGAEDKTPATTKSFTLKYDPTGKLITITVPITDSADTDANVIKALAPAFTVPAPAAKSDSAATPAPAGGTGTSK